MTRNPFGFHGGRFQSNSARTGPSRRSHLLSVTRFRCNPTPTEPPSATGQRLLHCRRTPRSSRRQALRPVRAPLGRVPAATRLRSAGPQRGRHLPAAVKSREQHRDEQPLVRRVPKRYLRDQLRYHPHRRLHGASGPSRVTISARDASSVMYPFALRSRWMSAASTRTNR